MRIAFLLGAGISIPARFPSTAKITDQVVSGRGFTRHTSGLFHPGPPNPAIPDEYTPRVLLFLNAIKAEVDLYLSRDDLGMSANYEDLFYIAQQVYGSEERYRPNAAIQRFVDGLAHSLRYALQARDGEDVSYWSLSRLADEAQNYILDVVAQMLTSTVPNQLDYLACLQDACQDSEVEGAVFFTLNHDLLLETYLRQSRVNFVDGFDEPVNNVRNWNPALFESGDARVRLVKLHGSVDWFTWRPSPNGAPTWVGISLSGEDRFGGYAKGTLPYPLSVRPILLAGTSNKTDMYYTSALFADIHNAFYRELGETDTLVVCGYGFRDEGVNARVTHWMDSSDSRRMIIVHPEPETVRTVMRWKWEEWKEQRRLVFVRRWIQDATWEEIKRYIAP